MRQDQYSKLQELSERLADVVINDADPSGWAGTGKKPGELTQQERGDAYWCRKMAVASIGVLTRVHVLIGQVHSSGLGTTPPADPEALDGGNPDLDAEVASAEKEAKRLLSEIQTGAGKAAFDKRVHGHAAS